MQQEKQIISFGGEGSDKDDTTLLDLYLLAQVPKKEPKICLIPTACGDNSNYIQYFYNKFKQYPCEFTYLSLFNPPSKDLKSFILDQEINIIYVSGGNTKSMLAVWREWELDTILQEAYANGIIMSGLSAGQVCWGAPFITDSTPGEYKVLQGLNLVSDSFAPHFNSQKQREPEYKRFIQEKQIPGGYGCFECAGVHIKDGKLFRAISCRPGAKVKRIELNNDQIVDKNVNTILLNAKKNLQKYILDSVPFSYLKEGQNESQNQEEKTIQD